MNRILISAGLIVISAFAAGAQDFKTGQDADLVLGHPSFTQSTTLTVTPKTMTVPSCVAVDPTSGKVFVSDAFGNRVLRFANSASLTNGESAELVIGQVNFSSGGANQGLAAPAANTLSDPIGVFVDPGGTLWVADAGNNRVLAFYGASALLPVTNAFADFELGQSNFTTNTSGNSNQKFSFPVGVFISAADTLYVTDFSNSRVEGYKQISQKLNVINPAADFVVGQAAFGASGSGSGAAQMTSPFSAIVDAADHLWVAERGNFRVSRFDHASSLPAGGAISTVALGQPDPASHVQSLTATGMGAPEGLALDSDGSLYVADNLYNRVLIYKNAVTKAGGAAAEIVLGQPNFTNALAGAEINTVPGANGMAFDPEGRLYVVNSGSNRVVRFTKPPLVAPTVSISGKKKRTTHAAHFKLKGNAAATDGTVALVQVKQSGGGYKTAHGVGPWHFKAKLSMGKNIFLVRAVGSNGLDSAAAKIIINRN